MKVIYTRLCFMSAACIVNQNLIFVNPKYSGDRPLLEHEIEHTRQMQRIGTWSFWWKYITSREFRLLAEVGAYKVQIAHGANIDRCAVNLSTKYALGITQAGAMELLR